MRWYIRWYYVFLASFLVVQRMDGHWFIMHATHWFAPQSAVPSMRWQTSMFRYFHHFPCFWDRNCSFVFVNEFARLRSPKHLFGIKGIFEPEPDGSGAYLERFCSLFAKCALFSFFLVGGFCPMALRWRFNEHPTHLKEYIGSCRKHRIRYERKWYFFTWMLIQPFFDCCDVLDGTIAYFNKDEEDSWFNSGAIHGAPFCQIHMFSLEEDVTHHRGFEKGDVATNSEHSHLVKLSPFLLTFPTDAKDPPTSLVVTPVLGENLFFSVNIIFSSL